MKSNLRLAHRYSRMTNGQRVVFAVNRAAPEPVNRRRRRINWCGVAIWVSYSLTVAAAVHFATLWWLR